eukprot:scaffold83324_cov34-Tisochrysis_lutea.AAC.1
MAKAKEPITSALMKAIDSMRSVRAAETAAASCSAALGSRNGCGVSAGVGAAGFPHARRACGSVLSCGRVGCAERTSGERSRVRVGLRRRAVKSRHFTGTEEERGEGRNPHATHTTFRERSTRPFCIGNGDRAPRSQSDHGPLSLYLVLSSPMDGEAPRALSLSKRPALT